jgi:hypothetical protein
VMMTLTMGLRSITASNLAFWMQNIDWHQGRSLVH